MPDCVLNLGLITCLCCALARSRACLHFCLLACLFVCLFVCSFSCLFVWVRACVCVFVVLVCGCVLCCMAFAERFYGSLIA